MRRQVPTSKRSTSPLGRRLPAPPQTQEKKRNEVRLPLTNAAIEKRTFPPQGRDGRRPCAVRRNAPASGKSRNEPSAPDIAHPPPVHRRRFPGSGAHIYKRPSSRPSGNSEARNPTMARQRARI